MRGVVRHLFFFVLVYSVALSSLLHYRSPTRDSPDPPTAPFDDVAHLMREQRHRRARRKSLKGAHKAHLA